MQESQPVRRSWKKQLVVGVLLLAALLYVISQIGARRELRLLALDSANGRIHWAAALAEAPYVLGRPEARDGRVFVSVANESNDENLYPPRIWKLVALEAA